MSDTETSVDPFDEPGSKGGSTYPHIGQLKGRLVIWRPTNLEKNIPGIEKGKVVDRMTVDVHVLDGEPIAQLLDGYGEVKTELDEPLTAPFVSEAMFVSQKVLVNQLRDAYRNEGLVLGRLSKDAPRQKGQQGAWSIETATPEDKAVAGAYWKQYLAAQKSKDPWD